MKEEDIRPQALFNRYLELVQSDIEGFFKDASGFVHVDCPACGSADQAGGFEKFGFDYVECASCGSLYLSPRPDRDTLARFYAEAESVKFWGTDFYKETAEARRQKLFIPRAKDIQALADRHATPAAGVYVDVGPGYGLILEEVAKLGRFAEVVGIEPAPTLAQLCRDKGFPVIEALVEDLDETAASADVLTAYEVLEHVSSPLDFLKGVARLMAPGGVALMTTLTVDGFDIQTLWDRAKAVYPPHHINLLSLSGYRRLMARAELEVVEISTPGNLDVDIVRNTAAESPDIDLPRFVNRIVRDGDDDARAAFQKFLRENDMSSHVRMIVQSTGNG